MFFTDCWPMKSEADGELVLHVLEHRAGDEDAAGLGQRLQPRGDVDAVAVEVAALDHDVAEIDADAEPHLPARRQRGVALGQRALDLDRALHRLDDAGELGQHVVTGGVDDAAAVVLDALRDRRAIAAQGRQRAGLVLPHQPAVAGDVGEEEGGQPALDRGVHDLPIAQAGRWCRAPRRVSNAAARRREGLGRRMKPQMNADECR
jgi:hypothetical protein